jgi:hypothetical protein
MASSRRSIIGGGEERQTNGTLVNRAAVEEAEPTSAAGSLDDPAPFKAAALSRIAGNCGPAGHASGGAAVRDEEPVSGSAILKSS